MGQVKGRRSEQVGMPLREAIVEAAAGKCEKSPDYLPSLGLSNDKKTVLVFGGSQGARAVNELFANTAALLGDVKDKIQFMHLTGSDDNAALENAYKAAGVAASIRRADPNIEQCYIASDLVVCRSGASSICELSLFGKPLTLIPLPTAADDHQTVNAKVLESAGAARHFAQKEATPEKLASLLKDFLENGATAAVRQAERRDESRPSDFECDEIAFCPRRSSDLSETELGHLHALLLQGLLQFVGLRQADVLLGELAVFEDQQGRNGHDLEFDGDVGIVVDVDLADGDIGEFVRKFLQNRALHAARAAPRSPEVNKNGAF